MKTSTIILLQRLLRTSENICRHRGYRSTGRYKSARTLVQLQRTYSSSSAPQEKEYSSKIQTIVDDISQLNLLEVADLNQLLKTRLNIPDAPVMAMGAVAQQTQAQKSEEEEDDSGPAAPQKMSFNVKLTGFSADKKIALIKEIKSLIPGSNLVQAKKMVESTPIIVKGDMSKDEADELLKQLKAVGAEAQIE